ncbi:MAG: hypothetical protein QM771_20575 [Nitrospira sp.]
MKKMMLTVMAAALLVAFSAPSFAGEEKKKEEKKGGHFLPDPLRGREEEGREEGWTSVPDRVWRREEERRKRKRAATKSHRFWGEASWLKRSSTLGWETSSVVYRFPTCRI